AWPEWVERLLIVALAIGFFAALVLAWYHGERGAQRASGTELLILALLLAIGGAVMWRVEMGSESFSGGRTGAHGGAHQQANDSDPISPDVPADRKSIAVLPFENLSDEKANAYFASGMQDMILTKLAAIGELKVISRTSTGKYASHPHDLKIIAQQLGVGTILEGSVQKSGNQVLINVQLIDANSDQHLWAEAYPRTLDNIFGVEGEVAQKVADALKTHLTPAETASVASLPTRNTAAYDLFLKAEYELQQAGDSWKQETFLAADADYNRAIALDPGFALAYAKLAYCQMRRHWFATPLSEAELAGVKTSIEQALALAPDLAEAHLALGYHLYWGFRRYDEAIGEFQRALQLVPSNADALAGLAFIARRKGQWQQSLAYMDKALLVSPRDGNLRGEQGASLVSMRRYAEAERQLKLALEFGPTNANAKDYLQLTRLFGFGDVAGAREAFRSPPDWRIAGENAFAGDVINLINPRVYPDVMERHFADALKAWDSAPTDTLEERLTGQVARVTIRVIAGQREAVRAECERLAPVLQAQLDRQPDSLNLLKKLSWVDICLGRNADALAAARRGVAQVPIEKDAYTIGPNLLVGLAQVAAHAGATDEALRAVRQLLAMPAGGVMSAARLRLDPVFDPLRKDPRFVELMRKADVQDGAPAHE
ncbi:MAG TPA: tetratricopeptide repeat protein, partial [Rudaea sp.]|nr:tetratricopeptide repeat protein [Rudaea sp.]